MDWEVTVTNLFKKAEDPATTKEEREALSEKAGYLMAKYGIKRLLDRPADLPLNVINIEIALGAPYPRVRASLVFGVAEAFNCRAILFNRTKTMRIYGLQEDIDNFVKMYVSLWIQALFALQLAEKPSDVHGKTHNHSYLLGYIHEVTGRVASATRKASKEATTETVSTALVFANRTNAVDAAVASAYPNLGKAAPTVPRGVTSYYAGVNAGTRADINQPRMGGSQPSNNTPTKRALT